MQVSGCVVLVTGAAGGIGGALVEALLARGAARVYATDLATADVDALVKRNAARVVALPLDVTQEDAVAEAAVRCPDVTLLINNAAILSFDGLIAAQELAPARAVFEVNMWGYLHMCRAFAPVLGNNGGGAIVNILSEAARVNAPFVGAYSASKAAAWSITQGVRAELRGQGTQVLAVFPSSTDTAMLAGLDGEKQPPADVATGTLDALERDDEDISIGEHSVHFEELMRRDPKAAEREFAAFLPGVVEVPE